jgi:uncharacterized membrane protein
VGIVVGAAIQVAGAVGVAAIQQSTAKKGMKLQEKLAEATLAHEQLLQQKRQEFEKSLVDASLVKATTVMETEEEQFEKKLKAVGTSPVLYLAAGVLVLAILYG